LVFVLIPLVDGKHRAHHYHQPTTENSINVFHSSTPYLCLLIRASLSVARMGEI